MIGYLAWTSSGVTYYTGISQQGTLVEIHKSQTRGLILLANGGRENGGCWGVDNNNFRKGYLNGWGWDDYHKDPKFKAAVDAAWAVLKA